MIENLLLFCPTLIQVAVAAKAQWLEPWSSGCDLLLPLSPARRTSPARQTMSNSYFRTGQVTKSLLVQDLFAIHILKASTLNHLANVKILAVSCKCTNIFSNPLVPITWPPRRPKKVQLVHEPSDPTGSLEWWSARPWGKSLARLFCIFSQPSSIRFWGSSQLKKGCPHTKLLEQQH